MLEFLPNIGLKAENYSEAVDIIKAQEESACLQYSGTDRVFWIGLVDDSIELLLDAHKEGEVLRADSLTIAYHDNNTYDVEEYQLPEADDSEDSIRLKLDGVTAPMVALPLVGLKQGLKGMKHDEHYQADVTLFPLAINYYDDYLEEGGAPIDFTSQRYENVSTLDDESGDDLVVSVVGAVDSFKVKKNPFSGMEYYHVELVTFTGSRYVVLLSQADATRPLYRGMMLSIAAIATASIVLKEGRSVHVAFDGTMTDEQFSTEVLDAIISLRNLRYEHLVLDFKGSAVVDDIHFIQTVYGMHEYVIEVGKFIDGTNRIFRLTEPELHKVLKCFHDIVMKRQIPNFSMWEDVTEEVLGKKRGDESYDSDCEENNSEA